MNDNFRILLINPPHIQKKAFPLAGEIFYHLLRINIFGFTPFADLVYVKAFK